MSKVLLITGGGRGIGAATARLAVSRGYSVCVNYLKDRDTAEALVKELGGKAIAVAGDVSVEADVLRLFESCDRAFGKLDALVNNAGIVATKARIDQVGAERLQRMMAVNVVGAFLCAREAIKRMSKKHGKQGGAIVNVSSGAARLGSPSEWVDYAASKGAIDTMTVGLAKEVAQEGIRVNAVRPGPIHTDIHASGGEPGRVDRVKSSVPMKRGGDPEEVARAILWLCSDESSYSTGTFIDVSGGR